MDPRPWQFFLFRANALGGRRVEPDLKTHEQATATDSVRGHGRRAVSRNGMGGLALCGGFPPSGPRRVLHRGYEQLALQSRAGWVQRGLPARRGIYRPGHGLGRPPGPLGLPRRRAGWPHLRPLGILLLAAFRATGCLDQPRGLDEIAWGAPSRAG